MPFIIPNFLLALGQTVYEKSVTFLHPSLSWRPRGTHWVKVYQSGWWCIARPLLSRCQISSRSDNPYTRYLLPKFVDFVDGVTRRQKTVNDVFLQAYHLATTNKYISLYIRPLNWHRTDPSGKALFVKRAAGAQGLCYCHQGIKSSKSSISEGLMHVAAWYRWTSKPKYTKFGNRCPLTSPLTFPNVVALQRKVCDISAVEKFCSQKKWPKFTKMALRLDMH